MEKVGKGWEKVAKADNRLNFLAKSAKSLQRLVDVGQYSQWIVDGIIFQTRDGGWWVREIKTES